MMNKNLEAVSAKSAMSLVLMSVVLLAALPCSAEILTLQNGMEVRGLVGRVASLGTDLFAGGAGGVDNQQVYFVDDGLRRVFFSTYQIDRDRTRDEIESLEIIGLHQPVQKQGSVIGTVAPFVKPPSPFDEYGRRTVTMHSPKGPLSIVQGITEVTPYYIRLEALHSLPKKSIQWDMRVATSSIPRATLSKVLETHVNQEDSEQRLQIVRLYLQSKRYEDARAELEAVIKDFPDLADLKGQLKELSRLHTAQKIGELKLRRKAGQHNLVWNLLEQFPADDTAAEQLLEIREMHEEYSKQLERIDSSLGRVDGFVKAMEEGALRDMMSTFQEELNLDLSVNTIDRLADFERLADDADLNNEQKLALAVSGWLTDGHAADNLTLASSLWRTRSVVQRYLVSSDAVSRTNLQAELSSEEANTPKHIARLIAAMKPPLANSAKPEAEERLDPAPADSAAADSPTAAAPVAEAIAENEAAENNGEAPDETDETDEAPPSPSTQTQEFFIQGIGDKKIRYLAHLPPEYDPYRRYPVVMSLHAAGSRPELQVDWWAGAMNSETGTRLGQASRHGYIVIAPDWTEPSQREYHYSAQEHAAVLFSLRDAFQRFSIDTDRVFLSGHTMGGDAAWDIALAHPDVWAGVIPINATADYGKKSPLYVARYSENAKHVSFYFVGGAKDGTRMKLNSRDLNRYLTRGGYDTMIVEFLGRGHENFYDEIQHLFTWMNLHKRDFNVTEFNVSTLRPWDNFFWWAEVSDLPSRSMILPAAWPAKARPAKIEGSIRNRKLVRLKTGAAKATIWLTPDLVDFDQQVEISVGNKTNRKVEPDVNVILEDARRRGDRIHPFWASFETATGKRSR